jgi:hypothetical protein
MTDQTIPNQITDNLGRVIKLKEITGKARVSFYRALGSVDAGNVGVVMEYWNVMAVDEIDGAKQATIKGLVDIEFMANELEKSNAGELIDQWLIKKKDEKSKITTKTEQTLKK